MIGARECGVMMDDFYQIVSLWRIVYRDIPNCDLFR